VKHDVRFGGWLTMTALVAVQVTFGVNYLVAKVALQELEPQAMAVIRIVGGAILLLAITRLSGRSWPRERGTWARLALYAVFGIVLNQLLFIEGLARTTPTHSSLIVATIPVTTLLIAVMLRREKLTRRKLMAPALALLGVVLIMRPDVASSNGATVLGDLLTLANGLSFSLFLVISRPLVKRSDPLAATAILMSFGALGIALVGYPEVLATDFAAISARTWWMLGYIIIFPTVIAYWLQFWALARTESSVVAFFIYLQPIIATSLSVLLLGDRPGLLVLTGGALIFLGVYVTMRR
jgi:drug/metabolite transporter (DMT)-like permease